MYKQLIIARQDLKMSPGKLAAQVSHAAMAFLTNKIKEQACFQKGLIVFNREGQAEFTDAYMATLIFGQELFDEWINGSFTKVICGARNRGALERGIELAKANDMEEGRDFFLIRDNCLTELEPEDADGRTLTCIGFRPMDSKKIDIVGKKFQLYHG